MTTPINSFQDILDALEGNPTLKDQLRRHVLTEELLQLPAQFFALHGDVTELKAGQADLQDRMGRVEGGLERVEGRLEGVEGRLDRVEGRLDRVEGRLDRVEGRLGNIEGRVGNIDGSLYEQRAVNRIIARADLLGIKGAQVAFSAAGQARQEFYDAMSAAIRAGLISRDEYHDLTGADLIIRGRNRRHAAVEISLGPGEDDMDRAIRRAGILHRATSEPAVPVVAAPDPPLALLQAGEERGLQVLNIPA